jgi:predicted RNA binding protein YcfA (HicA-like mRNA interferase family)
MKENTAMEASHSQLMHKNTQLVTIIPYNDIKNETIVIRIG